MSASVASAGGTSRARRRGRAAVVLVVAAAILLGVRAVAGPLARPGLGFAAKVVCSSVFVGGFTPEQALADLPDEPLARLIRTRIDARAARVTTSVPLVVRRTAVHRTGLGCTLEPAAAVAPAPAAAAARPGGDEWPDGERVEPRVPAAVDAAALERAMDRAFAEPDATSPRRTRAVVIVHGGRIIGERYAPGFTAEHRFAGWSMAKSVTGALVGIAIGEGRLALDADALRPEWQQPDDPRRAITVHDLLTMSSGLAFDERYSPTGEATRTLFARATSRRSRRRARWRTRQARGGAIRARRRICCRG